MLKSVIEIVYCIHDNNGYFAENADGISPSDELDTLFPGIHSVGATYLYCVLIATLSQPLTDAVRSYLKMLITQGKILDYQVKEVVSPL